MKILLAFLLVSFSNLSVASTVWLEVVIEKQYGTDKKLVIGLGENLKDAKEIADLMCPQHYRDAKVSCNIKATCKDGGWYAKTVGNDADGNYQAIEGASCGVTSRKHAIELALSACQSKGGVECGKGGYIWSGFDPNKKIYKRSRPLPYGPYSTHVCGVDVMLGDTKFCKKDCGSNNYCKEELKINN